MIIQELVALLSLKVDTKALDNFQNKMGDLRSSLLTLGAPVAAAAGVMFGFAKTTADVGDAAVKASQQVGVSVEKLQEYQYAGRLADVTNEEMVNGLRFLSRSMEEAVDGTQMQVDAFKKMGVSFKGADGKARDTGVVMEEIADKFANMENGAKKTAVAMDLFGRAGAKMIPLLNGGSKGFADMAEEARAFGVVIDEQSAKLSEEFNDNITRTMSLFAGVRNIVGAKLIPIINKLNIKFMEFFKANREIITEKIDKFFGTLGNVVEKTWKFFKALYDSASGVAEVFGGLENVITAAAYAMAIFAGAKVLFAIGQMVGAVMGLGHAFTLANAKALLIPILIGAAVVALGLIIEDIVAFFQGKDSVTGVIVEKFKSMFESLNNGFKGMGSGVRTFVAVLMTPFRMITMQIQNVLDLISVFRGKMSMKELGANAMDRLKGLNPMVANESLKTAMGFADGSAQAGSAPSLSEAVPGSGVSQNNNVEQNITVQVGDGVSPVEVGREVGRSVNAPLDNILRGAGRSFAGSGGY